MRKVAYRLIFGNASKQSSRNVGMLDENTFEATLIFDTIWTNYRDMRLLKSPHQMKATYNSMGVGAEVCNL